MSRETTDTPARPKPLEPAPRHLKTVNLPTATLGLDVGGDGRSLFASCVDGGVYEVDREGGEHRLIGRHGSFASSVCCPRSASEGATLVSGGYDGQLIWHDAARGREIRRLRAHGFWSWQIAISDAAGLVASGGGQYLCGGYRYEPRPAEEAPVKVHELSSGREVHALTHVPPVQSVAFSHDGRRLAAGNLMGEVRVWDAQSGRQLAAWTTPGFTGWGIIKGHYYTGGIFSMTFTPDGDELIVAGMGSTRDPAAGNGRQLWQRFAWREEPARKVDETHSGESGTGLMETIALHPSGEYFVMGGRIAQGKWNVAFFDASTGSILHSLSTKTRVTRAVFSPDGTELYLAGALSQGKPRDGTFAPYGRVSIYSLPRPRMAF